MDHCHLARLPVSATAHAGEPLPVPTFDGKPLTLPTACPAQPVLLIAGFSRASRDSCCAWSERLRSEPPANLVVYQMVVIDDVPRLLRGLVTMGMRKGVPPALQEHFLLVTEQGRAWRRLTDCAQPDVDYLLLLDARHQLRWHGAGPVDEVACRALLDTVSSLNACGAGTSPYFPLDAEDEGADKLCNGPTSTVPISLCAYSQTRSFSFA